VRKIGKDDLERVRKILSKGEPLSKIVIEQRFLFGKNKISFGDEHDKSEGEI